jgi:hypothetical protein
LRTVTAALSGLFAIGVDRSAGFPPNASPWWTLVGDGTRMIVLGIRPSTPADFALGAPGPRPMA